MSIFPRNDGLSRTTTAYFLENPGYKTTLGDCSKIRADKLQKLQNRAARIIAWADNSIRSSDVLNSLKWSHLEERGKRHFLIMMFKVINNNCPT